MRKHKSTNIIVVITFSLILVLSIGYISFGNEQSLKNNKQNLISYGSKKQKNIALTFDDGPHPEYTAEILDLLKEYDIKATFFVLGKLAEQYPDIIKRQAAEGHEIGNHTYSHVDVRKATREQFEEEFNKTQEIIRSLTDIESKVFRPPYGYFSSSLQNSVASYFTAFQSIEMAGIPPILGIYTVSSCL
ncbi:polysaccharide deacetylase family protein [Tissierella creatinophila]|uniref:Peptidoglycan-N-acetylglucosamine deacetylase n=1 Tax=Tissierella creatinophila DSM 6911 TaxID=1123403 RepID=A0A1U7M877_TISCR|nr:polysaccharide deacetylase family protein [Tissierella creatinophila]OLS03408.1 peptidoglycan-N-acetylglucosamine deacetylase [Tissierella creatinophila DSM 6911]